MVDLTIIYLTANRLPAHWVKFHKEKLLEAASGARIISVSREYSDIGTNLLQTQPISTANIFYQLYRGVRLAKTPYIAVAEDDTLYTKEHFQFRGEGFAYNANRWSLYTWGEPVYHLKNFIRTNAVMVAPTALTLEALEERFNKYPIDMKNIPIEMSGELGCYEKQLGVTPRKRIDYKSKTPTVQFDHDYFTGNRERKDAIERRHTKILGDIQAYDIPVWGTAENLVREFK